MEKGELIFLIVLFTLFISVLGAVLIYRFGSSVALVDKPNERSSHLVPTPRSGGIGIWLAFIIIGIILTKELVFIVIAASMGLLGFLEDIFNFSAKIRLIAQIIISTSAVGFFFSLPTSLEKMILFLFWIIFIVATLNIYNFMDGINGIAALTGIVGFGLLAVFSLLFIKASYIFLMSIVLVFACLGFLPFNFPKAKVFMGDVGSVFLGFVFSSFVVKLSLNFSIFLCLIMFLSTFYADSIMTIYYRWRRGENLMKAHRSHLYQYLSNELGLPHWKASLLYATVQLIIGILAIIAYMLSVAWQIILIVVCGIIFIFSYRLIKSIKPTSKIAS
jgi:UDP-N-acetylmuramyl pentapeptide phosphotransferase/UDP-N-acetylglucosamine-1-phosphate transferase